MTQDSNRANDKTTDAKFLRAVILRALILLAILAGSILLLDPARSLGKLSLYNSLFPGRPRFPYGENPQKSYSMTINDLDAMFASHVVVREKAADEFRVFILGDSSIWGTLLANDQTLSGLLNQQNLKTCEGKRVVFYNLGYPTISLEKDILILNHALAYQPDLIIWGMTLESFPGMNPSSSPLLGYNRAEVKELFPAAQLPAAESRTIVNQIQDERRGLADWMRYQLYGVMWAATGIDQDLAQTWQAAQRDFKNDSAFNEKAEFDLAAALDFTPVIKAMELAGDTPIWLVNEPILISGGENSQVRYNFFYPRWAYDAYRAALQSKADSEGWNFVDLWDLVPEDQFTNSAIHLNPEGERLLAEQMAQKIAAYLECK